MVVKCVTAKLITTPLPLHTGGLFPANTDKCCSCGKPRLVKQFRCRVDHSSTQICDKILTGVVVILSLSRGLQVVWLNYEGTLIIL